MISNNYDELSSLAYRRVLEASIDVSSAKKKGIFCKGAINTEE